MDRQRRIIRRAIAKHSFCTLATASAANRPLVTGVLYAAVGDLLYVSTLETSAKARNIRENHRVAVCIPVRRFPVGPPFTVQFQGTATVCPIDEPQHRRASLKPGASSRSPRTENSTIPTRAC